jgi:hypothetical protein
LDIPFFLIAARSFQPHLISLQKPLVRPFEASVRIYDLKTPSNCCPLKLLCSSWLHRISEPPANSGPGKVPGLSINLNVNAKEYHHGMD